MSKYEIPRELRHLRLPGDPAEYDAAVTVAWLASSAKPSGEVTQEAGNDAGSLLRQQVHGPLPAEEIESLIEGLVEIALAPDAHTACAYWCRSAMADSVLSVAVWPPSEGGKPVTAMSFAGSPPRRP